MEKSQQEIYKKQTAGSFDIQKGVCAETPQNNISDTTIEDSQLNKVNTAEQALEKDGPK